MESSQKEAFRLIQLSDCHILPDPRSTLYSINPRKNLEAVLRKIKQDAYSPNAIIITGDLVQDGSTEAYTELADIVSTQDCPIYYLPGNHDDTDVINKAFLANNIKSSRHLLWDSWQIILLDSTAPGLEDGFLAAIDFEYLKKYLAQYPNHHTLIALHHPPVAINSPMFDSIRLINWQTFLDEIAAYPNIKAVLFGHIHQLFETQKNNIKFLSAPSTAIQFLKDEVDYTLTPGYRWLELATFGQFKTGVIYL